MTTFTPQARLAAAAEHHARYLEENKRAGHVEHPGQTGFTGIRPVDRAVAAGYSSRAVSENVSVKFGTGSARESVDGLMGAIYHRLGFLDLTKDEIGVGYADGTEDSFVYVMGDGEVGKLCAGKEFSGVGKYYMHVCTDNDFRLSAVQYDQLTARQQRRNPAIVIWPSDGNDDVPPAFYSESPDPLPQADVSGYPISVQFNPAYFRKPPTHVSLALYSEAGHRKLNSIILMTLHNDPNHRFNAYEYALFPEKHLKWKQRYQAVLRYNDGQPHRRSWRFTTRDPGYPVHTVTADGQTIAVHTDTTFVVYMPPRNTADIDSTFESAPSTVHLSVAYLDLNTVKITATGEGTVAATFHRPFKIKVR